MISVPVYGQPPHEHAEDPLGSIGATIADGIAAAVARHGAGIINDAWDGITNLFGFDDCSDDNKAKYRRVINAMAPEELARQVIDGRIRGRDPANGAIRNATGNCLKYALRYAAKRLVDYSKQQAKPVDKTHTDPDTDAMRLSRAQWAVVDKYATRMLLRELGIEFGAITMRPNQAPPSLLPGETEEQRALRVVPQLESALERARVLALRAEPSGDDDGPGFVSGLIGGLLGGFGAGRLSKRR